MLIPQDFSLKQYYSVLPLLIISSHTAGTDYHPVNETLLFTSEADPIRCFDVNVITDSNMEEEETFSLLLSSSRHQLVVNEIASVTIMDNDSTSKPPRKG